MPETQNHSLIKNVSHWLKSIAILYLFDSSSISLYLLKVQCIYLHCVTVQAVHHKLPPFHFEKLCVGEDWIWDTRLQVVIYMFYHTYKLLQSHQEQLWCIAACEEIINSDVLTKECSFINVSYPDQYMYCVHLSVFRFIEFYS